MRYRQCWTTVKQVKLVGQSGALGFRTASKRGRGKRCSMPALRERGPVHDPVSQNGRCY